MNASIVSHSDKVKDVSFVGSFVRAASGLKVVAKIMC